MNDLVPIAVLLVVIAFVLGRLPRIELGLSDAYRRRRFFNWFPLGLTYAFLYMGRYNLNAAMSAKVLSAADYGTIFGVGAWVYGCSFLVNGPLADRFGGRRTILFAASGSALMNVLMGLAARAGYMKEHAAVTYSVLYGANMYFQSFGAVSVIKVNSAWFHVRERGVFGGIFGILISLGLYVAFDWGQKIADAFPGHIEWVFFIPAAILFAFWGICYSVVRDLPSGAGHPDIDTADASSGDTGPPLPLGAVLKKMLSNPVIMTIAAIELCSGFMRDAMMHWYKVYAVAMAPTRELAREQFVYKNWGMLLCVAGIMGGTFAGILSDRLFQSRRPPVAAVLYGIMLVGSVALLGAIVSPLLSGFVIVAMIMSVLGVHGVLSGTASADFGGKKNAGVATGIIDGFVYAGVGFQSLLLGRMLPGKEVTVAFLAEQKGVEGAAAAVARSWMIWPALMIPVAVVGLLMATRVWNARPKPQAAPEPDGAPKTTGHEAVSGHPQGVSKLPRRASREAQPKILEQTLALARAAKETGVVAFDLDSTLLDNRPRQALILREWAQKRGGPTAVLSLAAEHMDGWDLRVAMVNAGLSPAEAEAHYPDAKAFWRDRFFTSDYCKLDTAIPGAAAFVQALARTGVQIVYLTGRHTAMGPGTVASFEKAGIPVPDGKGVHLLLKPTFEQDDDAWKREAYDRLGKMGKVLSAFDNEPTHVNGYKERFPEAHVVHLDTDGSGRPVAVLASIPSVFDFVMGGGAGAPGG